MVREGVVGEGREGRGLDEEEAKQRALLKSLSCGKTFL